MKTISVLKTLVDLSNYANTTPNLDPMPTQPSTPNPTSALPKTPEGAFANCLRKRSKCPIIQAYRFISLQVHQLIDSSLCHRYKRRILYDQYKSMARWRHHR